jgi:hypothetical protein
MEIDMKASTRAGQLAFDILRNEFHLPIVDGKANRENIEDQITIGVYAGELDGITQEVVDLAIETIEDLIKVYEKK